MASTTRSGGVLRADVVGQVPQRDPGRDQERRRRRGQHEQHGHEEELCRDRVARADGEPDPRGDGVGEHHGHREERRDRAPGGHQREGEGRREKRRCARDLHRPLAAVERREAALGEAFEELLDRRGQVGHGLESGASFTFVPVLIVRWGGPGPERTNVRWTLADRCAMLSLDEP